eukprot:13009998-Alexandrium_andersonii.AAC.1
MGAQRAGATFWTPPILAPRSGPPSGGGQNGGPERRLQFRHSRYPLRPGETRRSSEKHPGSGGERQRPGMAH